MNNIQDIQHEIASVQLSIVDAENKIHAFMYHIHNLSLLLDKLEDELFAAKILKLCWTGR